MMVQPSNLKEPGTPAVRARSSKAKPPKTQSCFNSKALLERYGANLTLSCPETGFLFLVARIAEARPTANAGQEPSPLHFR
jgi:hypothetical protein